MADISFNCPICSQQLEAPAEYAGQVIECPACQKEIMVPNPEPVPGDVAETDPQEIMEVSGNKCPECGTVLGDGVVLCMQCGFHTKLGKKIATDFK